MIKDSYDAIIVGAGHNGICLAAYLQRAGLDVAIFEKRHEEASAVWTEEKTAPGFWTNHAVVMEFMDYMPFIQDFGLWDLGISTVYPEAQVGITFADGRPPIVLYNVDYDKNFEKSGKSIAMTSKSDADTYVGIRTKIREITPIINQFFYNPPQMPTAEDPDPLSSLGMYLMNLLGLPPELADKTPKDVIDHLFESPEMRTMFYRVSPEWTTPTEEEGMGAFSLISMFYMTCVGQLMVGGTHTLGHAMAMAAVREGAEIHERAPIKRIVVKNGKATGVELPNGRIIEAKQFVASNADTKQTLLKLIGEDNLSDQWVKRANNFRYGPSNTVAYFNYAMHEAPDYKSARHNPDINKCFMTYVGYECPDDILTQMRECEIAKKIPQKLAAGTVIPSLFTPSYTPPGKHIMTSGPYMPRAQDVSPEEWKDFEENAWKDNYEIYAKSSTNMTMDNLIAVNTQPPTEWQNEKGFVNGDFCNGHMCREQLAHKRPFPEAAQYQTEIENVYLCGPGQHPTGGVSAAPGYNAYKKICQDLNLKYKPWEGPRGY